MIETVKFLTSMFRQGFPCLFQMITGYYCPGCGGTRATVFLLHGDILKSVVVVLELGSFGLSKALKRPKLFVERYAMFTYIGIGIVVVNWIFKNYMLMRGIDLLP